MNLLNSCKWSRMEPNPQDLLQVQLTSIKCFNYDFPPNEAAKLLYSLKTRFYSWNKPPLHWKIRSQGMLLNSERANPALLWKGFPKTGAVWRSKALLKCEILFLSADSKNKKRIFSLSPSSAPDQCQTQSSLLLPQPPGTELGTRRGTYSPQHSRRKAKGSFSLQETPASLPKSAMERWAPLPHTPALSTGSFGFWFI